MTHDLAERATERLIAWRWPLFTVALVAAAAGWGAARQLDFDRSIENMFARGDPLLASYHRLQRTFAAGEMVLAAYADPELMTPAGLERVRETSEALRSLDGVRAILALQSAIGPSIINPESARAARFRDLFSGYTHSLDGRTAVVVCMLEPEATSGTPREATLRAIRAVITRRPQGTVAGEPVMVVDGFRYIEADGLVLGYLSTLLLLAVIALVLRSVRWVVMPLLVVQLALLMTRAVLVWSGLRLSMVSSMLTAIVTVVGVATVMHIIVRYDDARAAGLSPRDALLRTGGLLAAPVTWACATDAVGFAALLVTRVGPVQDFGLMMAIGALLVIPSVALVVPAVTLAGAGRRPARAAWGGARLGRGLERLLEWVAARPARVLCGALLLGAGVAAGARFLEVETDFTRNFRAGSPVVQSYAFVESRLGGAGAWDVLLPVPPRLVGDDGRAHLDWPYIEQVLALEARLRREVPGLTKTLSLADAVEAGKLIDARKVRLPAVLNAQVYGELKVMRARMPTFFRAMLGEDPEGGHLLRIMLRSPERQSAAVKRETIERVRRICRQEFPDAEVTGYYVLLTQLIESIVRDQWISFAAALAGIGLMLLIAFRSLRLALIALVPNALPILMVTGLLGWGAAAGLDVKLNMGAAMIAAVSLGLSVDSSIHYLSAFRRGVRDGLSRDEALRTAQRTVGRAAILATIALVVGFSALLRSQFVPTIYFGALVSLAMLGSLAGNLIVLPVLLICFTPPDHRCSE